SFSSMKKASRPASSAPNRERGSAPDSNASGSACSSEVESMMPTDRLTMRSTILDSRANENTAAAEILATPAMEVASRMEIRTGSILLTSGAEKCANRAFYSPGRIFAESGVGSGHAVGLEPGQGARPAVPGVGFDVAGTVVGVEGVAGVGIDHEGGFAAAF